MNFVETKLSGAFVIHPVRLEDERGGFARVFCKKEFAAIGHHKEFVQFNHSYNNKKGTVRGMHYQDSGYAEIKLVRCVKGSVYDVIVDVRKNSPTFLQWIGVELSSVLGNSIYIPEGFAHGFQTLEDNTELLYHHTNYYEPLSERGICFNDAMLNIRWPLQVTVVSEKDQGYPALTTNFKGIEL